MRKQDPRCISRSKIACTTSRIGNFFSSVVFFRNHSSFSSYSGSPIFLHFESVDVYGLVLASHVFRIAFAAEALIGTAEDIAEARSEQYSIIVTKVINSGFVRGFHDIDEHEESCNWMLYENEDQDRASAMNQTSEEET